MTVFYRKSVDNDLHFAYLFGNFEHLRVVCEHLALAFTDPLLNNLRMKSLLPFIFFIGIIGLLPAQDQSTSIRVYEILQSKCASCHSNSNPRAGLDLEGNGNTLLEKADAVYKNVVGVIPNNSTAKDKGYQLIQPGRIDKSFLFQKINNGLDKSMALDEGEADIMPLNGDLSNVEKELIRQWILWGAPKQGEVVSEALIKDFYGGKGAMAFPDDPPTPPHPSEGFQLKMGPFFMPPGGETELFHKYQLDNEEAIEVNRIEVNMSTFSHHFIIYDYGTPAEAVPEGFRFDQDHTQDVSFVASVAESQNILLPEKTAFFWDRHHVLDLNSHYINFNTDKVYQSEVYVNVYTQPRGQALHRMHSTLIPNFSINIPNNGDLITETASIKFFPFLADFIPSEIFAWSIGGHTHRYGAGYKVWTMKDDQKDDLIYDGSCPEGIPGCVAPFFDYQHIPIRKWDNFKYIDLREGVFHEAKYINDGPEPVAWGPTSKDEMMLFGVFYITDTTGLSLNLTTSTRDIDPVFEGVKVFPNPMVNHATMILPNELGIVDFKLFDMVGKEVKSLQGIRNGFLKIDKGILPEGMYIYTLKDEQGRIFSDKLIIGK